MLLDAQFSGIFGTFLILKGGQMNVCYNARVGNLLCGECKGDLAKESKSFMIEFKKRREKAKDVIANFMYDGESYEK